MLARRTDRAPGAFATAVGVHGTRIVDFEAPHVTAGCLRIVGARESRGQVRGAVLGAEARELHSHVVHISPAKPVVGDL